MRRNLPQNQQPSKSAPGRPPVSDGGGLATPPSRDSSSDAPTDPAAAIVVALNDAGAIYDALATEIRGSAAGWPPGAVAKLEDALNERYGDLIGGPAAVGRLVVLATQPTAA